MHNRYVAVDRLLGSVLWVAAAALVMVDTVTPVNTGDCGLLTGAGAATLCIRGYVMRLEQREQRAFNLGRDSVTDFRPRT